MLSSAAWKSLKPNSRMAFFALCTDWPCDPVNALVSSLSAAPILRGGTLIDCQSARLRTTRASQKMASATGRPHWIARTMELGELELATDEALGRLEPGG